MVELFFFFKELMEWIMESYSAKQSDFSKSSNLLNVK